MIKPFLAFLISIQVLFFPLPAYSQNQKAHPTGSSLEQPVIAESPPSPLKKRIQTDDLPSLPDRSRSQTARFNRGKPFYSIVIKKNKPQVQADFLLKSSPQRAWEVITDFERYKEFLKGCSASHILRKKGNQLAVKFGNSQFGLLQFDFTVIYTLDQENHLIQWHLREGPFYDYVGSWKLEAYGEYTRAIYTGYYRPRSAITDFIPEEAWINMLKKHEIPHYIRAFKKRIED